MVITYLSIILFLYILFSKAVEEQVQCVLGTWAQNYKIHCIAFVGKFISERRAGPYNQIGMPGSKFYMRHPIIVCTVKMF
ncbi:hypothetical protein RND81_09G002600 [Saponaria officinalis]|uniref:Secreted protein n=1 Tax=Saponaria officinalis TaxID=3572 RepID=A0AAW1IFN8_SAPOF